MPKTLSIPVGNTDMDAVCFGFGKTPLIILPGLADGLHTVRGRALTLALSHRAFAGRFRVYLFSRRNDLRQDTTIADMARDQANAMLHLGLENARVLGISQGGMVAMVLAAQYPHLVGRLVLASSTACASPTARKVLKGWIRMAESGDYTRLFADISEKTYSEQKLQSSRITYPVFAALTKPKSLDRFLISARACREHDARSMLSGIRCPTLVIGGNRDKILGPGAERELADAIPSSVLHVCEGMGHSIDEEYPGFNEKVMDFLLR